VRFDVLAVGDARRRELQRLRVGIGACDRDQLERPLVLRELLEGRHLARDCVGGLIRSFQSADDEYGGR
jgi:hypothetical protein